VLPDNAIRDLRLAAGVLRRIDVYDAAVTDTCRHMASELGRLADRLEARVVEDVPER